MDLYDALDIKKNASADEIRHAYRKRAQKTHPDKAGVEKTSEFQMIKHAYEVLSDPDKRKHYDETGNADDLDSPENIILQKFAELLINITVKVINDPESENLFFEANKNLDLNRQKYSADAITHRRNAKKLRQAAERSSHRMGGENLAHLTLTAAAADEDRKAEKFDRIVDQINQVGVMLKDYEYQCSAKKGIEI